MVLTIGSGTDGGKASYTCSHHQNLAGIKFTGSGHLAVQEALINICCFDDGTVTAEVGKGEKRGEVSVRKYGVNDQNVSVEHLLICIEQIKGLEQITDPAIFA